MTGTVCFKLMFAMQNLGDLGADGAGVKISSQKWYTWNCRPWFAYSLCNFYGATMMIKDNLLSSIPTVKHFQAKKLSAFLGQMLTVFGNK